MDIVPVPAFTDNYIWTLTDNNEACCIDPGDSRPVLEFLKQRKLSLTTILITHHHWDHTGGVVDLVHRFPKVTVYGPPDERIAGLTHRVTPIAKVSWSNLNFEILTIPGHTSTHIAYYEPNQKQLFCGDTLFSAGCGRVFDGTLEALYQSIQLLQSLPEDTQVYCAHEYTRKNLAFALTIEPDNQHAQEYLNFLNQHPNRCSLPSSIQVEKAINPFFRLHEPVIQSKVHETDPFAVFKKLRDMKNDF